MVRPMTAHWGIPDPAEDKGSAAEIALGFEDASRMLERRIGIFTPLLREIGGMDCATAKAADALTRARCLIAHTPSISSDAGASVILLFVFGIRLASARAGTSSHSPTQSGMLLRRVPVARVALIVLEPPLRSRFVR